MMILDGSVVAKGLKGNGGDLMVISEDLLSTAKLVWICLVLLTEAL